MSIRTSWLLALVLLASGAARAESLDLTQSYPDINVFDTSVNFVTDGSGGMLNITSGVPITYTETSGGTQHTLIADSFFDVFVELDASGNLLDPVDGLADFTISGDIDTNGDSISDYSGVLLRGDLTAFGFNEGTNQVPAIFEFTFNVLTGDALSSLFGSLGGIIFSFTNGAPSAWNFNSDFSDASANADVFAVPVPLAGLLGLAGFAMIGGYQRTRRNGNALTHAA